MYFVFCTGNPGWQRLHGISAALPGIVHPWASGQMWCETGSVLPSAGTAGGLVKGASWGAASIWDSLHTQIHPHSCRYCHCHNAWGERGRERTLNNIHCYKWISSYFCVREDFWDFSVIVIHCLYHWQIVIDSLYWLPLHSSKTSLALHSFFSSFLPVFCLSAPFSAVKITTPLDNWVLIPSLLSQVEVHCEGGLSCVDFGVVGESCCLSHSVTITSHCLQPLPLLLQLHQVGKWLLCLSQYHAEYCVATT